MARMSSDHEKPWYYPAIAQFLMGDAPRAVGIPPQHFARDLCCLERRLAREGESFLTKTLPAFGKAIDLALQGHIPLATLAFKKKRGSALPVFLQALLRRVFSDEGWVLDAPCHTSIRLLRQICLWCKKIEKGYSDESLRKAILDFKEVDGGLPGEDFVFPPRLLGPARAVVHSIFGTCPGLGAILPRHGPGSVAGGEGVVGKRRLQHCFIDLERVFRPVPFFFSLRDVAESPQLVTDRPRCQFGLSRTEFVEKDSGGPRTIGLEHAEYMWCQQAIKAWMYNHIEKCSKAKGHINFTDQSINRELTVKWKDYDTLDMSKASDRLSYALVHALFKGLPLWQWLAASRSPGTVLPTGELLWFKKFAPMGSAVCFPVEAVAFYALAVSALHSTGMPIQLACRSVYVYGDDLIVPHGYFEVLKKHFEACSLKFNEDKCCTHGKFRESCGMDSFDGTDVTPARMRKMYPGTDATGLIPIVEHSNSLMRRGYGFSAVALRDSAMAHFKQLKELRLPYSQRDLPILYWYDPVLPETVRFKTRDGITQVKGWYFRPLGLEGEADYEKMYLRESLSRGGPVGWLRGPQPVVRVLDAKYSGVLRKKRFTVVREYSRNHDQNEFPGTSGEPSQP
jgi:hypothetical protein